MLILVGVLVLLLAIALGVWALVVSIQATGPGVAFAIGLLAYVLVAPASTWLIVRGRRMRAIPATERLARDPRAPVLFLRSFEDDDLADPAPRMVPLGDRLQRRYEESLSGPLHAVGPVVSVRRPGSALPQLGGARLLVPGDAWKSAVEHLRARAAAVIVMIGRTRGLWWEITSSIESVSLERLVFFFPYVEDTELRRSVWQRFFNFVPARMPFSTSAYRRMEAERQARYAMFRTRVQPLLEKPLPPELGEAQFIDFLPDGTPRALPRVRPWWLSIVALVAPSTGRMSSNLRHTLNPFVEKLSSEGTEA